KTKKFSPAPKSIEKVQTGVSWNGYFVTGRSAFQGAAFTPVDPLPFPAPPKDGGDWNVEAYASTGDTLFIRQGKAIYRYAKGEKDLTLITDQGIHARLLAASKDGAALFVRGPEYLVAPAGEKDVKPRTIPVEPSPRNTHFL